MTTETEDQHIDPVGPVAGSDDVTDAEYAAWEKGEELAAEPATAEEPAEVTEPAEPVEEDEPASEKGAEEPLAAAVEDEDDAGLSRGLKKRLDKIREREAAAISRASAAEARAAAAEALLAAQGAEPPVETGDAPRPKDRVYTQAELAAEATRLAAQQVAADKFNSRCDEVAGIGQEKFGAKWAASLEALKDVGAISDDVSFLQDALDTEAPAQVLYHLGQNPDEAEHLLTLTPTRRAVALDRLAAKLATPAPKVAKPISKVPAPIAPVGSARGAKEIDLNDPNLSDEEAYAAHEAADRRRAGSAY